MASVQRYKVKPPTPSQWTVDGWTGMYDSRAKAGERDYDAPLLVNLLPIDPQRGAGLVLRPGMQRLTTPTTTQIPGGTEMSWIGAFTTAASTELIVVIAGGEIYTLSGSTLTKVITAAQLATATISLATIDKVFACEYNKTLVICDTASHAPFTWDGTTGAGLVKLTNAPLDRQGGPAVYYAKLFFIKSDSRTIVWSEENQANTGYEAVGYNNAWELTQTSERGVLALLGTNEVLYYFRRDAVGAIRGAVSSTFSTDGVHDGITQQAGIAFDSIPVHIGGAAWWISSRGGPMAFRPGTGLVDLALQLPRRFSTPQGITSPDGVIYGSVGEHHTFATGAAYKHITVDRQNGRVHFEGFNNTRRFTLVVDAESMRPVSYYVYPALNLPTGTGQKFSEIIDGIKYFADVSGYLFAELVAPESPYTAIGYDETHNGAGSAITGTMVGQMHGWTPNVEWQFDRLDVLADAQPSNTLTVGYITSRFHKASLTPTDQVVTDTSVSNTPYERHKSFGLGKDASGRWFRPIISIAGEATANRLPVLHGYTLTAYPVSTDPAVI